MNVHRDHCHAIEADGFHVGIEQLFVSSFQLHTRVASTNLIEQTHTDYGHVSAHVDTCICVNTAHLHCKHIKTTPFATLDAFDVQDRNARCALTHTSSYWSIWGTSSLVMITRYSHASSGESRW